MSHLSDDGPSASIAPRMAFFSRLRGGLLRDLYENPCQ
jgi:hypothetical protein